MKLKIKTIIRRVISLLPCLVVLPIVWVFTKCTFQEMWDEFLEFTDEDTDTPVGEF